ncbi:MAG: carboxymuconolactone decarboxylase family protein [Acidimicrobiia bacterium]
MARAERALTLPPRTEHDDDPQIAALLSQTNAKLGMIPNMYRNMANAPGLLETYLFGYDAFRSSSGFTPAEQETVLLAISVENGCNYCVAAHSTIADMSKVPAAITDALRSGDALPDARLDALASFTRAMVSTRGLPTAAQVQMFLGAGYGEDDILQILLAIAVKTISNYSNHLFHTDVDPAFAARTWKR